MYASIIEEIKEPKKASIKFQTKDIRSRVSVRGEQSKNVIAEAWLEPIRNPVTGKAHRAIIEIPEGFESTRMDQASMKTLVANDGYLSFRYERKHMVVFQKTLGKDHKVRPLIGIIGNKLLQ